MPFGTLNVWGHLLSVVARTFYHTIGRGGYLGWSAPHRAVVLVILSMGIGLFSTYVIAVVRVALLCEKVRS